MSVLDAVPDPVKGTVDGEFLVDASDFGTEHPGIWEVLSRRMYRGKPRKTGTLMVSCEPGRVTLCLSDKESSQVCFYTCDTVEEALAGLEAALQSRKADWRASKPRR